MLKKLEINFVKGFTRDRSHEGSFGGGCDHEHTGMLFSNGWIGFESHYSKLNQSPIPSNLSGVAAIFPSAITSCKAGKCLCRISTTSHYITSMLLCYTNRCDKYCKCVIFSTIEFIGYCSIHSMGAASRKARVSKARANNNDNTTITILFHLNIPTNIPGEISGCYHIIRVCIYTEPYAD